MTITRFVIIAVCAYLLGSLSFAIIVSKVTLGKDIRNYGSGNAGLTNAYRTMGASKTLLVLLGDIAKGAAAITIGAVLAGADEESLSAMEQIAADVGFAFQIQDDILDVTSTEETLGKPVLSDEKNQKTTYVTLEGLEKAKDDVARISERAKERLMTLPGEKEFLGEIIAMLVDREN